MTVEKRFKYLTEYQYELYLALPEQFTEKTAQKLLKTKHDVRVFSSLVKKDKFITNDKGTYTKIMPVAEIKLVIVIDTLWPVEKLNDAELMDFFLFAPKGFRRAYPTFYKSETMNAVE